LIEVFNKFIFVASSRLFILLLHTIPLAAEDPFQASGFSQNTATTIRSGLNLKPLNHAISINFGCSEIYSDVGTRNSYI